jgi:hypothetical protein
MPQLIGLLRRRWILAGLALGIECGAPKLVLTVLNQLDTPTQRQGPLRHPATAINEPVCVTSTSEAKALTISTAVLAG